jgi:hypothetical protein
MKNLDEDEDIAMLDNLLKKRLKQNIWEQDQKNHVL